MTSQMIICFVVLVGCMISYTLNKIPMSMTALIGMSILVVTDCITAKEAVANFGNANGIQMCAMFVVAAGLRRTQLVTNLSNLLYKVSKGRFSVMLAGFILLTWLLAQFISSPMVVAGIVLPIAAAAFEEVGINPARVAFPLGLVSIVCYGALPIGGNLSQVAKYNGYLETYDYMAYHFGILDFSKGRLPMSLLVLALAIFVVPKFCPQTGALESKKTEGKKKKEQEPLSPMRERMAYIIFFGTSLCLIFQSYIGVESWLITVIGAILVVVLGILTTKEATNAIPMSFYLLYVGSLSVGIGLTNTGAGELIGNQIIKVIGEHPSGYLLGAIFFGLAFVMTQFMLNRTVPEIIVPICILTCKAVGANPIGPLILVSNGTMASFLTPAATPAVPITMGFGGYNVRQVLKMGWLVAVVVAILSVAINMTIFPAYPV